ncbi:hypothetical protein J7K03_02835 [bacterium]|nr:hypothetical protein [bacterium]
MWLILAILAYFFLALSAFFDKYILGGGLPSPKIYCFFAGVISVSALGIIPLGVLLSLGPFPALSKIFPDGFALFFIPAPELILLSFFAGISFLSGLLIYYKGVYKFEVSRIAPAVGAGVPIFTLLLVWIFTFFPFLNEFQYRALIAREYFALVFLVGGSVILSIHREKLATFQSIKISAIASLLFSLSFVLTKLVYSFLPFWTGFIWIRVGVFLGALSLLVYPEVRGSIKKPAKGFAKRVALPFLFAKASGAIGGVLQNGAIFLAPLVFLPIINALSGIQYVFLMILATLFFFKFPEILKEEVSKKVLVQKTIAVWLIVAGLFLLSLS